MFDAPGGDLAVLERGLGTAGDAIRAAARDNPVRIGIANRHPDLAPLMETGAAKGWRTVDGAIEITIASENIGDMPAIGQSLRMVLGGVAELPSVEIMAGPMYSMVPVQAGNAFLSLAFRRDPRLTSREFREWWLHQHGPIAIPPLGPGLFAYDQVHVAMAETVAVASAFGAALVEYDAYDNLTWADHQAFLLSSSSDPAGMALVSADEAGRIDEGSRRFSIMTELR